MRLQPSMTNVEENNRIFQFGDVGPMNVESRWKQQSLCLRSLRAAHRFDNAHLPGQIKNHILF